MNSEEFFRKIVDIFNSSMHMTNEIFWLHGDLYQFEYLCMYTVKIYITNEIFWLHGGLYLSEDVYSENAYDK